MDREADSDSETDTATDQMLLAMVGEWTWCGRSRDGGSVGWGHECVDPGLHPPSLIHFYKRYRTLAGPAPLELLQPDPVPAPENSHYSRPDGTETWRPEVFVVTNNHQEPTDIPIFTEAKPGPDTELQHPAPVSAPENGHCLRPDGGGQQRGDRWRNVGRKVWWVGATP